MKARIAAALLSAAFMLAAAGAAAQKSDRGPSNRRPRVNGTFTDSANGLGVFSGTFSLTRFDVRNGVIVAIGTLKGALADSKGNPLGRVDQEAVLPVKDVTSTCDVLRFDLGPADVEILGVQVHLRKDVLGIEPRDGPPQTLGDLLCSSANLFDSHPAPDAIATALNEVLRTRGLPK